MLQVGSAAEIAFRRLHALSRYGYVPLFGQGETSADVLCRHRYDDAHAHLLSDGTVAWRQGTDPDVPDVVIRPEDANGFDALLRRGGQPRPQAHSPALRRMRRLIMLGYVLDRTPPPAQDEIMLHHWRGAPSLLLHADGHLRRASDSDATIAADDDAGFAALLDQVQPGERHRRRAELRIKLFSYATLFMRVVALLLMIRGLIAVVHHFI